MDENWVHGETRNHVLEKDDRNDGWFCADRQPFAFIRPPIRDP